MGAALFAITSGSMQFEDNVMCSEWMVIEVRAFDLIFSIGVTSFMESE